MLTYGQKPHQVTKFKIRCNKVSFTVLHATTRVCLSPTHMFPLLCHSLQYLWTLKVTDPAKALKLKQSLPPGLPRTDIPAPKK